MGRKSDLPENEKSLIIRKTAKCGPIKAIAKELGRRKRTI